VIIVDASVLIAHLDGRDAQHDLAVERLLEIAESPIGCSSITLAEILVGPARNSRLDVARDAIATLSVREIPLPADAAVRLARLRADTNLKLPDCCVLLAAQDELATSILTFDSRLDHAAASLGFETPGGRSA
jgi:predicted nucleic acid-binding protein